MDLITFRRRTFSKLEIYRVGRNFFFLFNLGLVGIQSNFIFFIKDRCGRRGEGHILNRKNPLESYLSLLMGPKSEVL